MLDVEFRKPDKALLELTRGAAGSGRGELKELIAFSAKAIKDLTKKGKRDFNNVQEAVDALEARHGIHIGTPAGTQVQQYHRAVGTGWRPEWHAVNARWY